MEKIMKNGEILKGADILLPQGSGLVYEVIRVIDGVPLFFEEHYQRMANTAQAAGLPGILSRESFRAMTDAFLGARAEQNYNFKVILDPQGGDLYVFEHPSAYPETALYERGIHTELMSFSRNNPNAKISNDDLTAQANDLREQSGAYEVLLVDNQGRITEGSRSNVFVIREGILLTPPLKSVLPGVTRLKIIETAAQMKMAWDEAEIPAAEIQLLEAAFISGTSPKILPIRSIGHLTLDSANHPLVRSLMAAFTRTIAKDLEQYRQP